MSGNGDAMKFSIITPVYNAEKYLERTIKSVLAQTFPCWEMICVDDGSSDASGQLLDACAAKDSRIKVIHQPNGGEGAARNAALKVATGDWIVFLDADDLLSPWALAEHARVADQCPETVMTRLDMVQFDGDSDPDWDAFRNVKPTIRKVDIRDVIPFEMSVAHFFQFAYNRSLLNGLEYTSHYVGADRVLLIKCLVRTDFVACSNVPSHAYRQIPTSIMGSGMTLRKFTDHIGYIRECIRLVDADCRKELSALAVREFGNLLTERAVYDIGRLLSAEDRREAWRMWYVALTWMKTMRGLPKWRRVTILLSNLLSWMPLNFVPRLLCGVPFRLKLMGMHR